MLFVLNESLMNGNVTSSIINTGVEAGSFLDAIAILKKRLAEFPGARIVQENPLGFRYVLKGDIYNTVGWMEGNALRMIE